MAATTDLVRRHGAHHLGALTETAPKRPDIARGLRAATATVVPMLLADVAHAPQLALVALGGWLGALADGGGAYRTRAAAMSAFLVLGSIGYFVGTLVGGSVPLALLATLLFTFACSLGRAWGDDGARVGGLIAATFLVALPSTSHDVHSALAHAGLVFGGGLWAMLIALVFWPVNPWQPARRAVAECYRALAAQTDRMRRLARRAEVRSARWAAARRHHQGIRDALEDARRILGGTRRRRVGGSRRADQLLVLTELADELFGALVAIAEELDAARDTEAEAARAALVRALGAVRDVLAAIAASTEENATPATIRVLDAAVASLPSASLESDTIADPSLWATARVVDRVVIAARAMAELARALPARTPATTTPTHAAPRASMRARWLEALAPESIVLRHAVRLAVTTTAGLALGEALHLPRAYWIALTALVVMQPYSGATIRKGLQRVGGSIIGGVIAAGLAVLLHSHLVVALLMFPLSVIAVALLPLNYSWFVLFLTPVFVLMAEPVFGDWRLAALRIGNTVIGGVLAFAGAYLLWPQWERHELPAQLARMLRALRELLDAVAANRDVDAARRQFGIAAGNAEATFQRVLGEGPGERMRIESVMALTTYARRLTAALIAIDAIGVGPLPRDVRADTDRIAHALDALATAVDERRAPPPLDLDADTLATAADTEPRMERELLRSQLLRATVQLKVLYAAATRLTDRG